MNIKSVILTVIISIALIATISFLFFRKDNSETRVSEKKDTKYVVKFYSGEVVLFNNNNIIKKFEEVNFDILPTEDKLRLEEGIVVSSVADAHVLIEDYDG